VEAVSPRVALALPRKKSKLNLDGQDATTTNSNLNNAPFLPVAWAVQISRLMLPNLKENCQEKIFQKVAKWGMSMAQGFVVNVLKSTACLGVQLAANAKNVWTDPPYLQLL
jgi:hypothetical protein|tara:strand:+ start:188 stop:520 length:333 start_codon:yes stop_codon:yes gene_type:complete